MPQDRKVAAVVHQDLEIWQKLNDADGTRYAPLIGLPVLVFAGSSEDLARARRRALERGLEPAIYTRALFGTFNDADNRAAVAVVRGDVLDLVGPALAAERRLVDKVLKGLALHR